jgi:tetratricopeptide (TPR) repeat protein
MPESRPAPAPRALFDAIIALAEGGELGAAEARCAQALAAHPGDVNLLALSGALALKRGRFEAAEADLRRAIAIAPGFAKPHEDLGTLLVARQRAFDAVPVLERALELDPKLERAWFELGKAFALQGRGKEADAAFARSFELSPERRMMAHAAEHQREGRLADAEHLYRRVLRHNPRNVDALRLYALIALAAGREAEAEKLLTQAIELAPDFLAALLDLGKLRKEQDRYAPAIECFDRVLALDPEHVQAEFLRASTLAPAAFTNEAIESYQRCLKLRPEHTGALLGLGHMYKAVGRFHDAVAAYEACRREQPDAGETYWSLANLKTYRFDEPMVQEMHRRVQVPELAPQSEVNLLFALAKAYEDRGDYEAAWRHYREGNQKQRKLVSYDPVQTEYVNDRLIEVFSADYLASHAGQGCADDAPIFIVGLPRSGSTLLEQILASHPQVEGTSELPYVGRITASLNRDRAPGKGYPESARELAPGAFAKLGTDYLASARVHRRTPRAFFIDKMPNNFPNIGLIALMLPNAKIIDARRHPLDACLSCYRQLFAKGQAFTYDLTEIGEYYLQYQRMLDHWHVVLPGKVLTVQYEEVVADIESQVRRLLEFCGLPWDDACLKFHESDRPVRTPSAEQVRQPIYDRSVGQWRHYEAHLEELLTVLAPLRARYARFETR